jgi:hypothetical protein
VKIHCQRCKTDFDRTFSSCPRCGLKADGNAQPAPEPKRQHSSAHSGRDAHTHGSSVPPSPTSKKAKSGNSGGWVILAIIVGMLFIGFVTDDSSTRSGQTTTKPPPAPKVRYEEYYVTAQKLNVRANPSADAAVIRQVSRFQTLNVSDVTDGWAKFRQPGFTSAYAAVRYLAKGNGHRAVVRNQSS